MNTSFNVEQFEKLKEFLPFLIPIIVVELILLIITLVHIFRHKTYKYGNRTLWVIVAIVGINFIGPILYFILGRDDN